MFLLFLLPTLALADGAPTEGKAPTSPEPIEAHTETATAATDEESTGMMLYAAPSAAEYIEADLLPYCQPLPGGGPSWMEKWADDIVFGVGLVVTGIFAGIGGWYRRRTPMPATIDDPRMDALERQVASLVPPPVHPRIAELEHANRALLQEAAEQRAARRATRPSDLDPEARLAQLRSRGKNLGA